MADRDRSFSEKATITLVDVTAALVADIVTDTRRQVIEKGWFGSPLDGPDSKLADMGHAPEGDGLHPFDPWGWTKMPLPSPTPEQLNWERKVEQTHQMTMDSDIDGIDR